MTRVLFVVAVVALLFAVEAQAMCTTPTDVTTLTLKDSNTFTPMEGSPNSNTAFDSANGDWNLYPDNANWSSRSSLAPANGGDFVHYLHNAGRTSGTTFIPDPTQGFIGGHVFMRATCVSTTDAVVYFAAVGAAFYNDPDQAGYVDKDPSASESWIEFTGVNGKVLSPANDCANFDPNSNVEAGFCDVSCTSSASDVGPYKACNHPTGFEGWLRLHADLDYIAEIHINSGGQTNTLSTGKESGCNTWMFQIPSCSGYNPDGPGPGPGPGPNSFKLAGSIQLDCSGTITDTDLHGKTVTLQGPSGSTDTILEGNTFSFDGLNPGTYTLLGQSFTIVGSDITGATITISEGTLGTECPDCVADDCCGACDDPDYEACKNPELSCTGDGDNFSCHATGGNTKKLKMSFANCVPPNC